ncbi:MAG: hypothetical protein NTY77_13010 [Elusimicrobia bacterium]|nr:hypothetical protein [Elusimicrobiota bacterium]
MPRNEVKPNLNLNQVHAVVAAREWLKAARELPEFSRDVRSFGPLASDSPGMKSLMAHCWGVVGIRVLLKKADFIVPPRHLAGKPAGFDPANYYVASERSSTFDVQYDKELLTQERFRQILDESGSPDEALARLRKGDY